MPVTPTYPGVYIEEVPSGVRTITGVATSIAAFIGFTARGPVDEAVRILSFADFERSFGGLHRDSDVSYAVQQFFQNGGTDAYVVRVAKNSKSATVTLKHGGGAADDALVVAAKSDGSWGNNLRLDIDYDTSNPDSLFNLGVTRYELQNNTIVLVETAQYRNLSMNRRSGAYALNVVNAASPLIQLTLPAGLTFDQRGFSLSGDLTAFPTLTGDDTNIVGLVDGDPFTLVLTGTPPADLDAAVTAIGAAITAAGLSDRLEVGRASALGAADVLGSFLRIGSKEVAANPNTADEFSSVTISSAATNDLAASLRLGLANGEKEGASNRRPLPTGTLGADLADEWGSDVNETIKVKVEDQSSDPATVLLAETSLTLAAKVGPALREALQGLLRGIGDPVTDEATVELWGGHLRVLPSAATPSASITFTDAGSVGLSGAGSFTNVQQYSLGSGATFGAQEDASLGSDGTPPDANELIGSPSTKTGMYALRDVDLFNLLAIPRTTKLVETEAKAVISKAIALCREQRAFFLLDPEPTQTVSSIAEWVAGVSTDKNAAVYFPQVRVADPLDGFRLRDMPPSGTMAGVMARTDAQRGVWKAPAGTEAVLRGVQALSYKLTDGENGTLNPKGVNCLRNFAVYGRIAWGSRTLQGNDAQASEWKYIPIRRLALFIEESLYRGTQWVVFEPNDEPLWAQIRLNVGAFMHNLFRQGAFQGTTPQQAYFVKCDGETTIQNDIDRGIVNIVVGFAPLKPAEFVVIQIQQIAGQIET